MSQYQLLPSPPHYEAPLTNGLDTVDDEADQYITDDDVTIRENRPRKKKRRSRPGKNRPHFTMPNVTGAYISAKLGVLNQGIRLHMGSLKELVDSSLPPQLILNGVDLRDTILKATSVAVSKIPPDLSCSLAQQLLQGRVYLLGSPRGLAPNPAVKHLLESVAISVDPEPLSWLTKLIDGIRSSSKKFALPVHYTLPSMRTDLCNMAVTMLSALLLEWEKDHHQRPPSSNSKPLPYQPILSGLNEADYLRIYGAPLLAGIPSLTVLERVSRPPAISNQPDFTVTKALPWTDTVISDPKRPASNYIYVDQAYIEGKLPSASKVEHYADLARVILDVSKMVRYNAHRFVVSATSSSLDYEYTGEAMYIGSYVIEGFRVVLARDGDWCFALPVYTVPMQHDLSNGQALASQLLTVAHHKLLMLENASMYQSR
ncbi:hypothetical protein HDU93_004792 [Gonapodya sp. JEL0774]|nr:hypothetical protein HDU93_004792 [Gonapodya sp. JEL0774]